MKKIYAVNALLLALLMTSVCSAAPTLTPPSTASVGAGMATLVLQSDSTGTGYFTLRPGSSVNCGSGEKVAFGPYSSGSYHGSRPLTGTVPGNYTVRNLSQNTPYTICFTADSPSGSGLNPEPVSANLTTGPATAFTSPGWSVAGNAGFSTGGANSTSLAFAPDGTPYIAFSDNDISGKATVMKFTAGVWGVVGTAGFSAGTASSISLTFAPDGTPFVAYGGDDYNVAGVTVMMFDGSDWNAVGSASIPADPVGFTSLAIAPDGVPHVAFADYSTASGGKVTVIKFSNGAWSIVGSAGFTAFDAAFISLAIAPDGTPYVAFSDYGNVGKATVMRFAGSGWVNVGSAGLSASAASSVSLTISPNGTPYVAYRDDGNFSRATVMKYDGNSWVSVGNAGLSAGGVDFTSLAIAPDGAPYVAYQDWTNSYKTTVKKYDDVGNVWRIVASSGFSAGTAGSISLAIAPDGTPHVGYGDGGNSSRTTVMKLINLPPTISGTPLTTATVGTAYSFTPAATFADSFGYAGTLPPGINFSTVSGALSGTPTIAGTYSDIVITAVNNFGNASLPKFSIEVAAVLGGNVMIGANIYATIAAALAAAVNGDTLKILSTIDPEGVNFAGSGLITLEGGYDAGWNRQPDLFSRVSSMTIASGTLVIDRIAVQ
jgi:hypothetical protein